MREDDRFTLYGKIFSSRLLLGTARYESPQLLLDSIADSQPAMITAAIRRETSGVREGGMSFFDLLSETGVPILPNTAGCKTAREAISTALLARELFDTPFIKLEVIGEEQNLQPDPYGLLEATTELVRLGFHVLPYCTEDIVLCRRLLEAGCEVLMPWASPIGTGQGPRNPNGLRELRLRFPHTTLIVDAGIGLPSHACQVMEWGFDGVLLNTSVAKAASPPGAAHAFSQAIQAGRTAFRSMPPPAKKLAEPSTSPMGLPSLRELTRV